MSRYVRALFARLGALLVISMVIAATFAVTGLVPAADAAGTTGAVPAGASTPLLDVSPTHPYYDAIVDITGRGIMDGYADGTFHPDALVLRAQFAKMVVNALRLPVTEGQVSPFPDLRPNDPRSLYPTDYAVVAYQNGITIGRGGLFEPYSNVSRAQLVTMIVRAYQKLRPGVLATPPSWFPSRFPSLMEPHRQNLRIADYNGLLVGIQGFDDPWKAPTRGEIAAILVNALKVEEAVKPARPLAPDEVDVVVYGNTLATAGLVTALDENDVTAPKVKVAILDPTDYREDPVSNGLGLEDLFAADSYSSGFYIRVRDSIRDAYLIRGIDPVRNGRLTTEPEVAASVLDSFVARGDVTVYRSVTLLSASDAEGEGYVRFRRGGRYGDTVTLKARSFVDAGVEGDLARLLGADYRVGRNEALYNDQVGPRPPRPAPENDYDAPQALSELLTLQVYQDGAAPPVESAGLPYYDPTSYDPLEFMLPRSTVDPAYFATSWSMVTAILPNDKRELNERWTDLLDPQASYDWFFGSPEQRDGVRRQVVDRAVNFVRFLQQHGYPQVGVATVSPWPYVRGDVRVEGVDVYTEAELTSASRRDVVSVGLYSLYDRHDAYFGPAGSSSTAVARVPMGALMPVGHPSLLVAEAVSSDCRTYNSAVRMEHVRANLGYAAGAILTIAQARRIDPQMVNYSAVAALLQARGFRLY